MLSTGAAGYEQGCLLKTQRFVDILGILAESPKQHAVALRHPVEGGEYIETSYLQFYNAIINTAARLRDSLDEDTVTVGYVSNSNASYAMNLFALMLLDITPVMLSPRNTVDTQIHLLESAGATALVYEPGYEAMAKECLDKLPRLVLKETVQLEPSLYAIPSSKPEPLSSSESDIHEKIVLIMHSSGTTDAPKLISISNRYAISIIQRYRMNRTFCQKLRGTMLAVSPLFHLFGLVNFIWFLSNWDTVVFPTSLSPNRILDVSERTGVTLVLLLPYQIKQLAEYCHSFPERWEILKRMNALHFGGAPLPSELGRVLLNQGVMLLNGYGTTETGFLAGGLSGANNPECRRLTLARGLKYQLCNGYKDTAQIRILADDQNLASGLCHKKEGYLLADRLRILGKDGFGLHLEVLGRVDDTLVHPSGEKTYPVPMENSLLDSPLIHRCVILNNQKIHNCLLIQLNKEEFLRHSPLHAIQDIHLAIDKANADAPVYSRIDRSLVYILPLATDKELPVTVKGNIARSKAEEMFQKELTKLDSDFTRAPPEGPVSGLEYQSVLIQIKSLLLNMSIDPESDFFEKGLDSLSAVKLKNQLRAIYPSANITANTLYDNTTAPDLAKYICHPPQPYSNLTSAQKEVNALIEANTRFPKPIKLIKSKHPRKLDVVVTGANGSLGNFILKDLLAQPWVEHIYAFARADSPEEAASRIQAGLHSRGIALGEEEWSRVKAFPFEPNTPFFDSIVGRAHVIYHAAWRMSFLHGLSQFNDCIESTSALLRLSATSHLRPTFHFVSSIGAALPVMKKNPIPEKELTTQLTQGGLITGYNLSKLVAEAICCKWSRQFKFPLHIHRVGQIVGDTSLGAWNTKEHIPLLIKASQVMGILPNKLTPYISWIPVDVAARAMVELNTSFLPIDAPIVHHIANPNLIPWESILDLLHAAGLQFKHVSPKHFFNTLYNTPKYQDPAINPLASLTQFWDSLLSPTSTYHLLQTTFTTHHSSVIRHCPEMDAPLVHKFIRHWMQTGFLTNP